MTLKLGDICKSKSLGEGLYEIIGEIGNEFVLKPRGGSRKNSKRAAKSSCEAPTPAERLAQFMPKQKERA